MTEQIRVYVGCAANGEDAESLMVLEHSLQRRTLRDVKIIPMYSGKHAHSWSGWDMSGWATPFSGFRWTIPEHLAFQGKAIYMDSDMIVLDDIGKLWDQDMPLGTSVLSKGGSNSWRFCVAMWNCAEAKNWLNIPLDRAKTMPLYHKRMMNMFTNMSEGVVRKFEGNWNCVDGEDLAIEDISILHYSDMSTQPHLKYALPRLEAAGQKHWFDGEVKMHWRQDVIDCFETEYQAALDSGYKVEDFIPAAPLLKYEKESQKSYDKFRNEWSK